MNLKKARINDIKDLQEICRTAYSLIFGDHWTENGLELYLERQFGTDRLNSELKDGGYFEYFFIKKEAQNIGFIKVNYQSSSELSDLDNCELEKIYILPNYGGMGIGKVAMTEIIKRVRNRGKKIIFLCVIDTNFSAIEFYKKLGFELHSITRLEVPHFRDELRGMQRMFLKLN